MVREIKVMGSDRPLTFTPWKPQNAFSVSEPYDPQAVGLWFEENRHRFDTAAECADNIPWDSLPHLASETLGDEMVGRRRAELEQRAASGDKYAASMLRGLAYDEPGDGV